MNMARNDPQNPDFHREFNRPRIIATIPNSSSRMLNSSSSPRLIQVQDRPVELCRNFRKGSCNLGERCKYSHDVGPVCPSPGMCKFYVEGRFCPFGKNCKFHHQVFRGSSSTDPRESSAVNIIPVSVGPPNDNRYWKTRLCQNWQDHGSCYRGSSCRFAHGDSELRALQRSPYQVETIKLEPEMAASTKNVAKRVVANSSEPKKKARRLADFDSSVKIKGIYGDWID